MHIQFKGTNYELAADVTARAERKIGQLKKYLGKRSEPTQVFVELGKDTGAHQSGAIWRTRINLIVVGVQHHAEAVAETMEAAIDKATSDLRSELQRATRKNESLFRKGGAMMKSLLRREVAE
jgi:ribosomal subunit interface protein